MHHFECSHVDNRQTRVVIWIIECQAQQHFGDFLAAFLLSHSFLVVTSMTIKSTLCKAQLHIESRRSVLVEKDPDFQSYVRAVSQEFAICRQFPSYACTTHKKERETLL